MNITNREVVFLTGLFPNEIRQEIIWNSKSNTQFAADSLQWAIANGLLHYYSNLKIINFPFIGGFPTIYRSPFVKTFEFNVNNQKVGYNRGFINFVGLKNFDIYFRTKNYLLKWYKKTNDNGLIIIYSAYLPFIKAAIEVKVKYPNLKICLILPDLPQYMKKSPNYLYEVVRKYMINQLNNAYLKIDYYILLSKYMAEKLPISNNQWTVVEGIYNEAHICSRLTSSLGRRKTLFYSGTLAARYGILHLIEAFKLLNSDYVLIICGDGDAKERIIEEAKSNKNIIYKGSIDRSEVLKLQKTASLLINPRTSEGEFTKYSFPSKTIEYLASEVPTLLYKLPGIPEEYYDYCFNLTDTSIISLRTKIEEIFELDKSILIDMGKRASEFIKVKKNPQAQCLKIYNLLETNYVQE